MLGGAFDVIGGVLLLFERKDREVLADLDLTTNQITGYAIGAIVLGIIAILIGLMLRNGSEFARYLVAIIAAVRLASLRVHHHPVRRHPLVLGHRPDAGVRASSPATCSSTRTPRRSSTARPPPSTGAAADGPPAPA